jgi:catechol 2,3-dioxygenase-like lactoylglutathione lyase family enzyme
VLDHVIVGVSDVTASKAFYERALAPLGMTVQLDFGELAVGFGRESKPWFWVGGGGRYAGPVHVAFAAPDRETVDAFHAAAMDAGAVDNGAPGLREMYHPAYYGAFVLDPDGHNIEAVCHRNPR